MPERYNTLRESPAEVENTLSRVTEDRKYAIEAAIVRVMKSKQTLSLAECVANVSRLLQSRFLPDVAVINARVDALVEREYLERNGSTLTYLA